MERKGGEGCLFVWGRLLKRGCLSEQRPSTISPLHLFVSWANLSSVVQACPQEILNLYILSPGYFEGGGAPPFCLSRGFQFKAFLVSIPGCSFTAWPVHLNFLQPICIWMGALPDISHGNSFVTVSVRVISDFFSCTNWKMWMKLYRNECVRSTWMNDWMIDQTHEWIKKGRMEGTRVRRTADVTLLVSII